MKKKKMMINLLFSLLLYHTIEVTNPPSNYRIIIAEVTAYSSDSDQTDSTPDLTAWQTKTRPGVIACPRYISFGTKVEIDGRRYTCEDRMNIKWPDRWDIWYNSYDMAIKFGIHNKIIKIYEH